eukprot:9684704-Alexandrium_andersonii.AAC.1
MTTSAAALLPVRRSSMDLAARVDAKMTRFLALSLRPSNCSSPAFASSAARRRSGSLQTDQSTRSS